MSDILELLKTKFFLIAAVMVMVCGAIFITISEGESMFVISGAVFLLVGFLLLISGYMTPVVSETMSGMAIGLFLILGAIMGIVGAFSIFNAEDIAYPLLIGSMVVTALSCLSWPCICCQRSSGVKSQIIGVASAHDKISITELSNISGAPIKLTSEIVYDAIGKGKLKGHMDGDVFVRASGAAPTSYTAPATTTREREVVKVLVICPYCGAKTEQGLSKCQNCQADL